MRIFFPKVKVTLQAIAFSIIFCGSTYANSSQEESTLGSELMSLFFSEDKTDQKVEIPYVKPKTSLNANMYELLAVAQSVLPEVTLEKFYPEESPPAYRIQFASSIQIDGYGAYADKIDSYDVNVWYADERYQDIAVLAVASISAHLGGEAKADKYLKVISDLQQEVAKKSKKRKSDDEIVISKKYDNRLFKFTFFPDLSFGVISISQINKK